MELIGTSIIERAGENGYPFYRIPGIVVSAAGTILVCYEARHGSDWSVIDLYARRFEDGGKTWEDRIPLLSGANKNTVNNPVMIADGKILHCLCLENYKRLFYLRSADDGRTWTPPREITHALDARYADYPWTCAAVGPGHGIKTGKGRLLAPVWLASNPAEITRHQPSRVSTLYSDDGGETWSLGEVFSPAGSVNPNEACLAELSDGRILMNIRTMRPADQPRTQPHFRHMAISASGIGDWLETWEERQLPDPVCAGGMCAFPGGILFTNCASYISRSNQTLRKSADDGKTWSESCLYNPLGGYSDCAYNPYTKTAFIAHEYDAETEIRVSEIRL